MQKTFLKFVVFELVERVARFRLLLNDAADALHETSPGLKISLEEQAAALEESLLAHKTMMNRLFAEGNNARQSLSDLEPVLAEINGKLQALSRILLHAKRPELLPETFLFLKDALPEDLLKNVGEQSVLLVAEGEANPVGNGFLSNVLVDSLPILQKNNPLAWVSLSRAYARHLLESASSLESFKLDVLKAEKSGNGKNTEFEAQLDRLLLHALNLRLQGPAYYFQALSDAVFASDWQFFHLVEPALFFGLNHQNFTHKNLVILHEASERARPELTDALQPLSEEVLSDLFRRVEKLVPAKAAFQEKHFERAIQLQERLNNGVLLSSTPLYPVGEVAENLTRSRENDSFSIYETLGMMTEYPHAPREIVNAGWLHKLERQPVWLYSVFNEERGEGYDRVVALLEYQDHLLQKSIEVSEVHRVLLCSS